jgi:predicted Zn-ribbon and HTH transcriptional regulator
MPRELICNACGEVFDKDDVNKITTTYESYYGVSDLFPNSTRMTYSVCPYCGSEDIEDFIYREDEETEYEE